MGKKSKRKSSKKYNSKEIPVDMIGIYKNDLEIVLNCFNDYFEKYSKNCIIEKINANYYLQTLNKSAIKHLIGSFLIKTEIFLLLEMNQLKVIKKVNYVHT